MAVSITRTANPAGVATDGSNVATYSTVSIGSASADRIVVVGVVCEDNATINSVTIDSGGGATAMNAGSAGSFGTAKARLFWLPVASGTTATIAVTYSEGVLDTLNGIAVYSVTGADTSALASSGNDGTTDNDATDPLTTGSVTIPADGGFLGVACNISDTATHTWANATEDLDVDSGGFRTTSAIRTTSGTVTITCTGTVNGADAALSWAIFNPTPTFSVAPTMFAVL